MHVLGTSQIADTCPYVCPRFSSPDWIFLVIVLAIAGGIVYAVRGSAVNESLKKQKEAMKVRARRPIHCIVAHPTPCDHPAKGRSSVLGRTVAQDKPSQGLTGGRGGEYAWAGQLGKERRGYQQAQVCFQVWSRWGEW